MSHRTLHSVNNLLANLVLPPKFLKLPDLKINHPYIITKLFISTHPKHGDAVVAKILVDNIEKDIYLPKRFLELGHENVSLIESAITSGTTYLLEYQGPGGQRSSNVAIYPKYASS